MSWFSVLIVVLVLLLVVFIISLFFKEKLRLFIKIELIILIIGTVFVSIVIIGRLIFEEENDYANLESISFNINQNDIIHIEENKIIDQNNVEIIVTSKNKKIGSYYIPIECYDYENYIFIVYSHSQDKLNNSLFIKESYEKDSLLYIVSKVTGCGILFTRHNYVYHYRYKLDSIIFIDDKTFVMEMYDLFEPKFKQIGIFDIIEYENDIVITEQWITNVNVICKIIKYAITKECYVILGQNDDDEIILDVVKYKRHIDYTVNGDYIDGFSTSISYLGKYSEKYINELYLLEGYYKIIDNKIYYLDNNLVVREIINDSYYEKITNLSEWDE